MQPIILGLIVLLVVSLLGVALFYVGTKFFLNVSKDVSNASKTTSANKTPDRPTLPNVPTQSVPTTQLITKPIQDNTLECWSQIGYQGYIVQSVPLNYPNPYSNSGIINIDSKTQSIRYQPGNYEIFYIIAPTSPISIATITNALSSDTPNIPIPDNNQLFILIKSTLTTAPPPPPPQPPLTIQLFTGNNYTGDNISFTQQQLIYELGYVIYTSNNSNKKYTSIRWNIPNLQVYIADKQNSNNYQSDFAACKIQGIMICNIFPENYSILLESSCPSLSIDLFAVYMNIS
jgi:hypothetical protein